MGACRESSKMERSLDRFMSKLRSVDKILWLYSGKNIENEKHPLSALDWLDEEIEDAHRLWMDFLEEKRNERLRVIEIHNKKFPPKVNQLEDQVAASVLHALTNLKS